MSATLNSQHFADYFASTPTGQFFIPTVAKVEKETSKRRRGNRQWSDEHDDDDSFQISTKSEEFTSAGALELTD